MKPRTVNGCVAFAFDPKREAILLVAGDKTGGSQKGSTAPSSIRLTRDFLNTSNAEERLKLEMLKGARQQKEKMMKTLQE